VLEKETAMKMADMCFNWKVVAGLAVVGVGVWAVKPELIGAALPLLLVAACPLSMLFMMRGMGGGQCASQPQQSREAQRPTEVRGVALPGRIRDEDLADLKARATDLQGRHQEIVRAIARLEAEESPVVREAAAVARAADARVRG